jgi:hypothetical protein
VHNFYVAAPKGGIIDAARAARTPVDADRVHARMATLTRLHPATFSKVERILDAKGFINIPF